MFATTTLSPAMLRVAVEVSRVIRKCLMLAGLVFMLALGSAWRGDSSLLDTLMAIGATESTVADEGEDGLDDVALQPVSAAQVDHLNPGMRRVLRYVSRRYHVSTEALQPIFAAAQQSGRELGIDPLLIVAVIGIESRFNPFSESGYGAQGLMQVVPRFHADKLPDDAGELPFFDPVTNVQIGARVLKESISRSGGLVEGLQQFGGASNDPERRYSNKVLSEMQRLEQAVLQMRKA